MGFLIFAYRKLSLIRRIHDLQYRQMVLTEREHRITDQIGLVQQAVSIGKNIINTLSSGSLFTLQKEIRDKYTDPATGQVSLKPEDQQKLMLEMDERKNQILYATGASNSIFEASNQAIMGPLNAEDSSITMQIKAIDSQLTLMNKELESVEKGESEAAKMCTPKFGLG